MAPAQEGLWTRKSEFFYRTFQVSVGFQGLYSEKLGNKCPRSHPRIREQKDSSEFAASDKFWRKAERCSTCDREISCVRSWGIFSSCSKYRNQDLWDWVELRLGPRCFDMKPFPAILGSVLGKTSRTLTILQKEITDVTKMILGDERVWETERAMHTCPTGFSAFLSRNLICLWTCAHCSGS